MVIGAGPAGLAAAWELVRQGRRPLVLEASGALGGIARTEQWRGHRFDIGGHRFFTREPEVEGLWREMLGEELLTVSRLSRIHSRGRYFAYPLELLDALRHTGVVEGGRIAASYLAACLRRRGGEESFEDWVVNRFGRRLYETFFKTYTEKVWGIPCRSIRADWAAQRIRGLSLPRAVVNAVLGNGGADTLIRQFLYPRLGPGMMWERFRDRVVAGGGEVRLGAAVAALQHDGGRVRELVVRGRHGEERVACDLVISSMPVAALANGLDPAAPEEVLEAAAGLRYRAMVVVGLVLDRAEVFPDNWIYVHDPEVRVGRIQNFKRWSAAMCAAPEVTNLGFEYFCDEGDATWSLPDDELVALAAAELERLGLGRADEVEGGVVFRQSRAYPVYDETYRDRLEVIWRHLDRLRNLRSVGRNGLHRYNNLDHSMLTGIQAARELTGA